MLDLVLSILKVVVKLEESSVLSESDHKQLSSTRKERCINDKAKVENFRKSQ